MDDTFDYQDGRTESVAPEAIAAPPVTAGPVLLDRAAIRNAVDQVYEIVPVPEWGGAVRVKGITAIERDAYETDILRGKGKERDVNLKLARAKLVVRATVDDAGERVFSEGDITWLGTKSAAALNRVYDAAARLAGLTETDLEEMVDDFTLDQTASGSTA